MGHSVSLGVTQSIQGPGIAVELLQEREAHGDRGPWPWQTQSRARPWDTGKETKNEAKKQQPPTACKSTAKSLQMPWGIGQAKSQGRFWEEAQLPPRAIQNHSTVTFPRAGGGRAPRRPPAGGSVLAARAVAEPSPRGYSLCRGCGTGGALRNICQLPGPRRRPARTSCLCFSAEHTPSGLCQR